MNRIADISVKDLVNKLWGSPYAFAAWRLPESTDRHLIVSLNDVVRTSTKMSELSPGFLVNKFSDNHPTNPYHIPCDLSFKNESASIATDISSEKIDQFLTELNQPSKRHATKNQAFNSQDMSDQFEQMVAEAIDQIKKGTFEKVVLARFEDIPLSSDFCIQSFFDRICTQYPTAFCSMVYLPDGGLWMGATPELLLSDDHHSFKTIALAGTKPLLSGQTLAEIAWTQKEIEEQAFVSRYIVNCFKKIRLREFTEKGPKTIQAGNMAHLKTEYVVDYQSLNFDQLGEQMLELLHPTSAVCGMPLAEAKAFIDEKEQFNRDFYAGYLGPVNFDNSTNLFVNLRCVQIGHNSARLYAGAGITEDSIPSNECKETALKMSVLKQLIT